MKRLHIRNDTENAIRRICACPSKMYFCDKYINSITQFLTDQLRSVSKVIFYSCVENNVNFVNFFSSISYLYFRTIKMGKPYVILGKRKSINCIKLLSLWICGKPKDNALSHMPAKWMFNDVHRKFNIFDRPSMLLPHLHFTVAHLLPRNTVYEKYQTQNPFVVPSFDPLKSGVIKCCDFIEIIQFEFNYSTQVHQISIS